MLWTAVGIWIEPLRSTLHYGQINVLLMLAVLLRSDGWQVAYLGADTPFIDAVAPKVGLLSVGYRNRFRHPNEAVVARYVERRIELRRTDREGALRVMLPAVPDAQPGITGQQAACRYWSERSCARVLP